MKPPSKGPGRGAAAGTGRSQGGKARVKTAKGRKIASTRWLERQLNDPYVKAAKAAGYRSRAAFKLLELNEQFKFLRSANRIVDLGAAPGGWCQVCLEIKPKAHVVAIDILDMELLPKVEIFKADICQAETAQLIRGALQGPADLVLSDMAANTIGHKATDHLRTMGLIEAALDLAEDVLAEGGYFVAKVLAGGADHTLLQRLKQRFKTVKHVKPPASRKESSEWYVVAQGYRAALTKEASQP